MAPKRPTRTQKRSKSASRRAPAPPVTPARRPWGLIAGTMAVVLFAVAVIGYGVYRIQESGSQTPEAVAATAAEIDGVVKKDYPGRDHQQGAVKYDQSPPFGGAHDSRWADCTGTIYASAIRPENAVHSLEHGAVWVAYRPDLPADQVAALREQVEGTEYRMLSPYPGLKEAVALQSWGYQLKLPSASDDRIPEFLGKLTQNSATTPEYGASCANPGFKNNPLPPATGSAPPKPATGG